MFNNVKSYITLCLLKFYKVLHSYITFNKVLQIKGYIVELSYVKSKVELSYVQSYKVELSYVKSYKVELSYVTLGLSMLIVTKLS